MARRRNRRFLGIPDEFWIAFVIMVGFFLKLVYDIEVGMKPGTLNAGSWSAAAGEGGWSGRLGFIRYLTDRRALPDFDPRGIPGFSEPPLYQVFCALLMTLFHRVMGWRAGTALHAILCCNVIFVMAGECCGIGILYRLGVRGRKMVTGILFLIFFPVFYHLSASLDGHALAFMLSMLSLSGTMSWFESRRYSVLRGSALALGLALMTSYDAAAVIPAELVFLIHALRDGRRNQVPLRKQYRNCAVIAAVPALAWPVRQLLLFRIPPFYPGPPTGSLISAPVLRRLSLPGALSMRHFHTTGNAAFEYNIWGQLFKTGLADFHAVNLSLNGTRIMMTAALYLSVALCAAAHAALLYTLFSSRLSRPYAHFLLFGYLGMLAFILISAIARPYTGTVRLMNTVPVLLFPLSGLMVCGSGDASDNLFERAVSAAGSGLILILAFLTAFLYGFYY